MLQIRRSNKDIPTLAELKNSLKCRHQSKLHTSAELPISNFGNFDIDIVHSKLSRLIIFLYPGANTPSLLGRDSAIDKSSLECFSWVIKTLSVFIISLSTVEWTSPIIVYIRWFTLPQRSVRYLRHAPPGLRGDLTTSGDLLTFGFPSSHL